MLTSSCSWRGADDCGEAVGHQRLRVGKGNSQPCHHQQAGAHSWRTAATEEEEARRSKARLRQEVKRGMCVSGKMGNPARNARSVCMPAACMWHAHMHRHAQTHGLLHAHSTSSDAMRGAATSLAPFRAFLPLSRQCGAHSSAIWNAIAARPRCAQRAPFVHRIPQCIASLDARKLMLRRWTSARRPAAWTSAWKRWTPRCVCAGAVASRRMQGRVCGGHAVRS